jgi:hypothetical protein
MKSTIFRNHRDCFLWSWSGTINVAKYIDALELRNHLSSLNGIVVELEIVVDEEATEEEKAINERLVMLSV